MCSTERTFYNMMWRQKVAQSKMSGKPGEMQNKKTLWAISFCMKKPYRVASKVSPHTGQTVVSRYLARGSSLRLLI